MRSRERMAPGGGGSGGPRAGREACASGRRARRGVAMLAFVAAMLVLGLGGLWAQQRSAGASAGYLGHYLSSGALYAAESGAEIALREVKVAADVDGDGVVGSVSDDGNDGNDPALASGSVHVGQAAKTYTAAGYWQGYRRVTEVVIQ